MALLSVRWLCYVTFTVPNIIIISTCTYKYENGNNITKFCTSINKYSFDYAEMSDYYTDTQQASSDRECPMCLQRHLSNIF